MTRFCTDKAWIRAAKTVPSKPHASMAINAVSADGARTGANQRPHCGAGSERCRKNGGAGKNGDGSGTSALRASGGGGSCSVLLERNRMPDVRCSSDTQLQLVEEHAMVIKRSPEDSSSSEITPEHVYQNRREFLRTARRWRVSAARPSAHACSLTRASPVARHRTTSSRRTTGLPPTIIFTSSAPPSQIRLPTQRISEQRRGP